MSELVAVPETRQIFQQDNSSPQNFVMFSHKKLYSEIEK